VAGAKIKLMGSSGVCEFAASPNQGARGRFIKLVSRQRAIPRGKKRCPLKDKKVLSATREGGTKNSSRNVGHASETGVALVLVTYLGVA
jgi:hypothetical protein